MIPVSDIQKMIVSLGKPIVDSAFQEMLSTRIPSPTASRALKRFAKRWKDYSRSALMVLCCEAVGGDPSLVYPAAKCLVLSGGAFDLHDDIVDQSYIRTNKKKKTTLGIFGEEVTLILGDALLIEGISKLVDLSERMDPHKVRLIVKAVKDGLFELGSAEVEELKLVRNVNVRPSRYLRIVNMKAADVEAYARVGAMIGGGTPQEIDALGKFGRCLGSIAILRDDIEDTFNDEAELFSRITKESLPLPVIYALSSPALKKKIESCSMSCSNSEIPEILSLIEKSEGFEKTKRKIESLILNSKTALNNVRNPDRLLSLFKT